MKPFIPLSRRLLIFLVMLGIDHATGNPAWATEEAGPIMEGCESNCEDPNAGGVDFFLFMRANDCVYGTSSDEGCTTPPDAWGDAQSVWQAVLDYAPSPNDPSAPTFFVGLPSLFPGASFVVPVSVHDDQGNSFVDYSGAVVLELAPTGSGIIDPPLWAFEPPNDPAHDFVLQLEDVGVQSTLIVGDPNSSFAQYFFLPGVQIFWDDRVSLTFQ